MQRAFSSIKILSINAFSVQNIKVSSEIILFSKVIEVANIYCNMRLRNYLSHTK